ncbi:MAG: CPBP family intramembrane metalloprotease [Myxococcales bacterium]|nr:CPBP family intramembrane metalloprotease [Myxococcales bacterium]MCB9540846.1 CPBP family intramembrane metalloprotease [Myxococcales bacterium]
MPLLSALFRLYHVIAPEDVEGGGRLGRFEIGVLVITAIGLTITQFGGSERVFLDLFADPLRETVAADLRAAGDDIGASIASPRDHGFYALLMLCHWVAFCVIGYVIAPAIWLRLNRRSIIAGSYLRLGGFTHHIGVYALLLGLVMAPVVVVSFQPAYQAIYPFYPHAGRSLFDLIAWELAYGVQFFALEFLFRGFLLDGLRRWIGYGAVFVMVIPYCMLHFQKTGSESLGAIVAGVILGCLAMKYRSIWGGVMLHWGVAVAMDLLSLWHQDLLPTRWWPPGM